MYAWIILGIVALLSLLLYKKLGSCTKYVIFTAVTGLITLFAVGICSTNLLYFNSLTVCTAAVAGIPGVITTILLNYFLL